MPIITLAVLLFFGAAVLLFSNLQGLALERHESFQTIRRLKQIDMTPQDMRKRELARPFLERVLFPGLVRLSRIGKRFTPANVVERLTEELGYAGSPESWDAERIIAMKVLGIGVGVVAAVVLGAIGFGAVRGIVLAAVLAFVGYYMPEWVVRSRAKKRQHLIRRALPDALDLLSITVEAGLGFDSAVARVARQAGGPLGEELHRMLQEMQLGKPRADALRDLGDRSSSVLQSSRSITPSFTNRG
ncbi:MAG: type II secretion system F family protein [Actinobacteria bacterium]|nr:type II secretion system F family protein [Actinomycetota bacterium]